ncbi:hypothetical protein NV379_10870 [Paenibacillus sp. N1-5-1-14]|uniref:hypothetical protein n=1 Tax=Paenibacillus radicibacter TaxID=2972488 RepID=UPI0021596D65|nr:hypothetical protein [Paenibacillus radicibacter]MCR8643162.1 hypothetical protein [Paenibacillus radicibacter]
MDDRFDQQDIESNKMISLVGYILFFIPLLAAKDSKYATYHANQGLMLLICAVAGNFVLGLIPFIGWMLIPLFSLFILVLFIIGISNAVTGKAVPLPLIGQFTIIKHR